MIRPSTALLNGAIAIAGLTLLSAGSAFAFPENDRLGYHSCSTCHLSPTGGGVLLPYGKGAGAEALPTWGSERNGEYLLNHFGKNPEWFLGGGDIRYLSLDVHPLKSVQPDQKQEFLMQADAEFALSPISGLWFDATVGEYGPEHSQEFRRHFMLVNMFDGAATARLGRFFPAYGIEFADHTLPTREGLGFGEGRETYNAEVSVKGKWFEAFATQVFGDSGVLNLGGDGQRATYGTKSETATIGKATAFLGQWGQAGVSYLRGTGANAEREAYGAHVMAFYDRFAYFLGEIDRQMNTDEPAHILSSATLGAEMIKGVHLQLYREATDEKTTPPGYGIGAQWIPYPHFELYTKVKLEPGIVTGLLMAHVWL